MTQDTLVDACAVAEQHLQPYLDGVLSAELVAVVDAHLAECEWCARAYAFERRFRVYLKDCVGGADEGCCREEFRRRLERCRQASSDS